MNKIYFYNLNEIYEIVGMIEEMIKKNPQKLEFLKGYMMGTINKKKMP